MSQNSLAWEYVVKKGDTISNILYETDIGPIYGKKGYLYKVYNLNKRKLKSPFAIIQPGIKITLPDGVYFPQKGKYAKNEFVKIDDKKVCEVEPVKEAIEKIIEVERKPTTIEEAKPEIKPDVKAEPIRPKDQFTYLKIAPQVSWLKVESQSQADVIEAISKSNYGVLFNYGMKLSDEFSAYAFGYFSQVNFYENEEYVVTKKNFTRQAMGVGAELRSDNRVKYNMRLGFFDEFFLTLHNSKEIRVEMGQIPELHWGVRRPIKKIGSAEIELGVFGKLNFPYEVQNIKGQFGYGLGSDLSTNLFGQGIRVFYNYSSTKATSKSSNTSEIGFNLFFEKDFLP